MCLYTMTGLSENWALKKLRNPGQQGQRHREKTEFSKCWEPDEDSHTKERTDWTCERTKGQQGRSKFKKRQRGGPRKDKTNSYWWKKAFLVISQTLRTNKPETQTDPIMTRVTLWWQAPLISDEALMPMGAEGASESSLWAIAGPKRLSKSSNRCPF